MKQFGKILKFEMKNYFTNKVFVGITLFLVVALAVVMFIPRISESFENEDATAGDNGELPIMIVIADSEENSLLVKEAFAAAFTDYKVEVSSEDISAVKEKIVNGELDCAFVFSSFTEYTYYVNNLSMYDANTSVADSILQNIYRMGIDRRQTRVDLMEQLLAAGKGNFMCDVSVDDEDSLMEKKLIFDRRQILRCDFMARDEFDTGRHYADMVLRDFRHLQVRTVLVKDDRVAVGLIEELNARGVKVPDELQVIGFDNLVDAPYFRVPLTSIEVPVLENTRRVLDHILDGVPLERNTVNRANIVWRESASL